MMTTTNSTPLTASEKIRGLGLIAQRVDAETAERFCQELNGCSLDEMTTREQVGAVITAANRTLWNIR